MRMDPRLLERRNSLSPLVADHDRSRMSAVWPWSSLQPSDRAAHVMRVGCVSFQA